MTALNPKERLLRRSEEAALRHGRDQDEGERHREPPGPGDLFQFPETAEFQWAVLERDPEGRFRAVAADVHPAIGSPDVAVPPESACGALSLRCRFGVWLKADNFDLERRTGSLEPAVLERARQKRAALDGGHPVGSPAEQETDREPEYQDLVKELEWARAALRERRETATEPGNRVVPARRPAKRWVSMSSPYALAAMILLAVSLALGAGMVGQVRNIEQLVREQELTHEALRQEQQERQRLDDSHRQLREESRQAEREYQEQIAAFERRAGLDEPDEPLVHLPFAWLSPQKEVRGPVKTVTLARSASYVVLILEVSDPEPHPGYRLDMLEKDADTPLFSRVVAQAELTEVSVVLPRRLLGAGEYQLRLYGLRDGEAELVGEYGLSLELE